MHIPKTAGASIEKSLSELDGTEDVSLMMQLKRERYIAKTLCDNIDYLYFMFVRNPYDRLVSVYRHSMRKRRRFPRLDFTDWLIAIEDFFKKGDDDGRLSTFDKRHARSQSLYIPKENTMYFGTPIKNKPENMIVGKFENLNEEYSNITKKIGKTLELPHEDWGSKNKVDISEYYTERAREIVSTLFLEDFNKFNYIL
jgi:hypothetical protein